MREQAKASTKRTELGKTEQRGAFLWVLFIFGVQFRIHGRFCSPTEINEIDCTP